ncbi:acyl carrier protein [Flavobacterium sp. SORGH_AS 622]|nr:acyl carrier protein [Flavobacterium sp. SORGH_AS_0622]
MNKEEIIARINGFLVDEFEVDNDDIEPDANLKRHTWIRQFRLC